MFLLRTRLLDIIYVSSAVCLFPLLLSFYLSLLFNFLDPRLACPLLAAVQIAVNPENPFHLTAPIPSALRLPSATFNSSMCPAAFGTEMDTKMLVTKFIHKHDTGHSVC